MKNPNDFEVTNRIVNGYFYSFEFISNTYKETWDRFPMIYCLGDMDKNPNCIAGLNLHKMPLSERIKFIIELNRNYPFINKEKSDDEIRCNASINELNSYFRKYKECIRYYNRKHIFNPLRIKNNCIQFYIEYDGSPQGCDRSTVMTEYHLTDDDNIDLSEKEGK